MGETLGTIGWANTPQAQKEFEKEEIDGQVFFVADCVAYTPEQLGIGESPFSAAEKASTPRWKDGVVPYRYVSAFTNNEKGFFEKATKMWTEATGAVSFVEDVAKTKSPFVRVSKITQKMNKASNGAVDSAFIQIGFLNVGSIAHELGHVLGLVHEHQRADRDNFVTVGDAVKTNANFRKHGAGEDKVRTEYDFESIMHYGARVELNGAAVVALTPKPGFTQFASKMGQRDRISEKDKQAIRAMYG